MSKLLIIAIVNVCSNSDYTPIQKTECVSVFGNCVAQYKREDHAIKMCKIKWKSVEQDIK